MWHACMAGPTPPAAPAPVPAPCVAWQAIREGKSEKLSFTATVAPFKDPQGFDVVPTITGVLVNGGERLCSTKAIQGEKCVPDATINANGTSATLMPGISIKRSSPKRPGPGRVYLLRFSATAAATGMSCTGYAAVCVVEQPRTLGGALPPSCAPFPDASTVRIATRCSNVTMPFAAAGKALDAGA
jgi:hypothetical protein